MTTKIKLTESQRELILKTQELLPKSERTFNQRKIFIKEHEEGFIKCEIRWDDNCKNGHNSFAVTGEVNKNRNFTDRGCISAGCIHEDIEKYFPEFKHLIKWHLFDSKGPIYYYENTLYFASDRDYNGLLKGEVKSYKKVVYFNNVPIGHIFDNVLIKAIEDGYNFKDGKIVAHEHNKDVKTCGTNYSFENIYRYDRADWCGCLFSSLKEAEEIKKALSDCTYKIVSTPNSWGEGKEIELDKARSCAVWPEANLEDFTVEKLATRLPSMVENFKVDIEELGFIY